jgi:hypothetical protein
MSVIEVTTYRPASRGHLISILSELPGTRWEFISHGYWGELWSMDRKHRIILGVNDAHS